MVSATLCKPTSFMSCYIAQCYTVALLTVVFDLSHSSVYVSLPTSSHFANLQSVIFQSARFQSVIVQSRNFQSCKFSYPVYGTTHVNVSIDDRNRRLLSGSSSWQIWRYEAIQCLQNKPVVTLSILPSTPDLSYCVPNGPDLRIRRKYQNVLVAVWRLCGSAAVAGQVGRYWQAPSRPSWHFSPFPHHHRPSAAAAATVAIMS